VTRVAVTPATALAIGIRFHQAARLQEAESIYKTLLGVNPDQPDVLHFLGVLSHQLGRSDEAIDLIRRAIARAPDYADAHNNLGNVLKELERQEEAAECYRTVISLKPDHTEAYNNLGNVLRRQGMIAEAIAAYETAIRLKPDCPDAYQNLGNALKGIGRLDEAVSAYSKAIALRPSDGTAYMLYRNLGHALYRSGQSEKAVRVIREWLMREPDNPFAQHLLAAFSGQGVPERASDEYVRRLFDEYAVTFEESLRELKYRAPELIGSAIANELAPAGGDLDVLDAGCGTGLCAPLLRPYARRLVGVDLSPKMVTKAQARGLYDEILTAELTGFLEQRTDEYDVIVSADTLVYFGVLESVCAAAACALRPGGRVLFTLERAQESDAPRGFRLHPHGRYSHTEGYVQRALAVAGLQVGSIVEASLRLEAAEPVAGIVVVARKPPPAA
jgi:predicted TPR repeat methyltransferase